MRKLAEYKCEICSSRFFSRKKDVRFCSNKCRAKGVNNLLKNNKPANFKEGKIRNCTICGASLHSQTKTGLCKNHYITDELKEKRSKIAKEKKFGGYKRGSGIGKGGWYRSEIAGEVYLDSSWEIEIAKILDSFQYKWERNKDRFPYEYDAKKLIYIPDFKIDLSDRFIYLEIKGYQTEKSKAKKEQFTRALIEINKESYLEILENPESLRNIIKTN